MIVDGHEASQYCHRPPYVPLGSAGAWAEMDFSAATLARKSIPPSSPRYGTAADLSDGFHQFTDPELGGLFGFDFPELANAYGAEKFYCDQTHQVIPIDASALVFPVYIGLPMRWSWSLWFR